VVVDIALIKRPLGAVGAMVFDHASGAFDGGPRRSPRHLPS
jgi:hypothetical protein